MTLSALVSRLLDIYEDSNWYLTYLGVIFLCWTLLACFFTSFSSPWEIMKDLLHTLQNNFVSSSGTYFNHVYLISHSLLILHIILNFLEAMSPLSCHWEFNESAHREPNNNYSFLISHVAYWLIFRYC
jgi:hypothetical protein